MRIHSILSLSGVDGYGNRTVVFLQGCNLQCKYCHNRDTWDLSAGQEMSGDEIIEKIKKNAAYFGKRGGVTFSGGEPLTQAKELLSVVKELQGLNIHTAIDTSGSIINEYTDKLIETADLVILDIKHTDETEYRKLTGGSLQKTLDNLNKLKMLKKDFWIRQVIIHGVNDGKEQVLKLKELSAGASRIELLPYHTLGIEKWQNLGASYDFASVQPTSKETIQDLQKLL